MKLIQNRELGRIFIMIKSEDPELRDLAINILGDKNIIRWNWMTLIAFHMFIFLATLTLMIYLSYRFHLGLYLIPLITLVLFQGFWSVFHLITIWKFRIQYNQHMQQTKDS